MSRQAKNWAIKKLPYLLSAIFLALTILNFIRYMGFVNQENGGMALLNLFFAIASGYWSRYYFYKARNK